MSFLYVAASISTTCFAHGIIPMGKFKSFFSRRIRTTDRVYWIALTFAAPSYVAAQEPEAMPRLPPTEIVYTLSLTPAPYVRCNTLDIGRSPSRTPRLKKPHQVLGIGASYNRILWKCSAREAPALIRLFLRAVLKG
jgi:hypothetical protein